jgi:hypothetical protein
MSSHGALAALVSCALHVGVLKWRGRLATLTPVAGWRLPHSPNRYKLPIAPTTQTRMRYNDKMDEGRSDLR